VPDDRRALSSPGLSSEQWGAIFEHRIKPNLLQGGVPVSAPTVVLLAGQPGSGKTAVARLLATPGSVTIDVDRFRYFHPAYAPDSVAAGVNGDVRRWFETSLDWLMQHRVNIVAEHGLTEHLIGRFAAASYRVDIALMAVPAAVSRLGILERYQLGMESSGQGRRVPAAVHDERFRALPAIADALCADSRITTISIYSRAGRLLYSGSDQIGGGTIHRGPGAVIEAERHRAWTQAEEAEFAALHASLLDRMAPQWAEELAAGYASALPYLGSSTADGRKAVGQAARAYPITAVRSGAGSAQPPPAAQTLPAGRRRDLEAGR